MLVRLLGFTSITLTLLSACCPPPPPPAPTNLTASLPVPRTYPLSTQQRMEAVHHWEVLAEDAGNEFATQILARFPDPLDSVYVAPCGVTPFAKAFRELLVTKLVAKGMRISNNTNERLVAMFDTQLVRHPRRYLKAGPRSYRALAPGVMVGTEISNADLKEISQEWPEVVPASDPRAAKSPYLFELPRNELIVTLSLLSKGEFVLRRTSVYYIDDAEYANYGPTTNKADDCATRAREYTLVDH